MSKKTHKTAFFDLDGTLIYTDSNTIPEYNVKTLEYMNSKGIDIVIATGRMHESALNCYRQLNCTGHMISFNGGIISKYDHLTKVFEIIKHFPVDLVSMKEIFRIFNSFDNRELTMFLFNKDNLFYDKKGEQSSVYEKRSNVRGEIITLKEIPDFLSTKILIAARKGEGEKLDFLEKELIQLDSSITVSRSKKHYLEINGKNVSKGNALKFLRTIYQDSEFIAFGDSYNDVSMFEEADISIIPEDGEEVIKKIATYTTTKGIDGGIEHAVKNILKL